LQIMKTPRKGADMTAPLAWHQADNFTKHYHLSGFHAGAIKAFLTQQPTAAVKQYPSPT